MSTPVFFFFSAPLPFHRNALSCKRIPCWQTRVLELLALVRHTTSGHYSDFSGCYGPSEYHAWLLPVFSACGYLSV